MRSRWLFMLFDAFVILSMLLAGCALSTPAPEEGPPPEEAPPGEEAPPPEEEAPPPEAEGIPENIAVYGFLDDPPTLDPFMCWAWEGIIVNELYETLTFYNYPGSDELLSPRLATSWESNEDGTEWTFYLREGVKFHDGMDFNAEAVKFSVETFMNPEIPASFVYDAVESVEVVDDYTVKFNLSYPSPMDLVMSGMYGAFMVSPSAADKDTEWFDAGHSLGTAPYQLESYLPGERLVMTYFQDYWKPWEAGQFTKVVYEMITDATVREQMIRGGTADFAGGLSAENIPSLQEDPNLVVDLMPGFQNFFGYINTLHPPLDNVKVRQALALSLPYQAVVDTLYGGYGTQASGMVPAGMWGHSDDLALTQDLDRAADLLEEAGYPGGGFEVAMWAGEDDPTYAQIAELWKPEMEKIGVTMNIVNMAWSAMTDIATTNPEEAHDLLTNTWWPTYVTPGDYLYSNFYSDQWFNWSYYSNPEFDALVDEAFTLSATDIEAASQKFIEAQEILIEDAPGYFIIDVPDYHVIRADIKGYRNNPAYTHVPFWYNLSR